MGAEKKEMFFFHSTSTSYSTEILKEIVNLTRIERSKVTLVFPVMVQGPEEVLILCIV